MAQQTDWSFGPVSGPLVGGLTAAALTIAQPFIGYPVWLPAALAAVGAGCAVLVGVVRATAPGNIAFRALCWMAAGGWTVWALLDGWSWFVLAALVGAMLVTGLLAECFAPHVERDPLAAPLIGPVLPTGRTQEWADRLTRIGKVEGGVTVMEIDDWPGRSGYTIHGEFPPESGVTWTTLRDVADKLAAAKRLPIGCPVTAEIGNHQGGFVLHVPTINGLREDLPYPMDCSPRSVRNPFPIGQFLDKSPTDIELYQAAGLIVGAREGGKTVLLQNITGSLVRCVDAVVWHVDLNGGGISAPWIMPWANGDADEPAIDWVANGADEALRVAQVGLAIVKDRKTRYQRLLIQQNTDVLPVTPEIPEIIVVVDEGGEVTGADASKAAQRAGNALRELQRIGRAMCVNVVFSQQRATAEYLPSQMKKNAKLKICMVVEDDAEIAHLLDWNRGLRAADLVTAGCGYVRRSSREVPRQFKGYLLRPAEIAQLAIGTAHLRPALDEPARRIGGAVYAERWARAGKWLAVLRGELVVDEPGIDQASVDAAGQASDRVPGANMPVVQAGMSLAQEAIDKLRAAQRGDAPAEPMPDWAREAQASLDQLVTAEPVRPTRTQPEAPETAPAPTTLAERHALVVQLVSGAGAEGMRTGDIVAGVQAAGVAVSRQTVSEWLAALAQAGKLTSPKQGTWTIGQAV